MPGHRKEGSVPWPIRPFSFFHCFFFFPIWFRILLPPFFNLPPLPPLPPLLLPPLPYHAPLSPCRAPDSHALSFNVPVCLFVSPGISVDVEHEWTRLSFLPFLLAHWFTLIRIPICPSPYHRTPFFFLGLHLLQQLQEKQITRTDKQTYSKQRQSTRQKQNNTRKIKLYTLQLTKTSVGTSRKWEKELSERERERDREALVPELWR